MGAATKATGWCGVTCVVTCVVTCGAIRVYAFQLEMANTTCTKYVVALMAITVIAVFMSQYNEDVAGTTIVKEDDGAHFKVNGGLPDTGYGGRGPDLADEFPRFRLAKESALKEAPAAKFGAAALKCRTLRNKAYLKCGVKYCDARKTCNNACEKKFGQPKRKIVPLTEGGPKFYHVHEVTVKENRAKEKRAK